MAGSSQTERGPSQSRSAGSAATTGTTGTTHAVEGAERARIAGKEAPTWRRWGPYLSERAWGTVREDYSAHGTAWEALPHDHARSRAFRWSEDGLAGISDDQQRVCFAFAFHNGADPILKERLFGLTGNEGNHGEDAKELWWHRDATPSHAWLRWQYAYPQRAFPYDELVATNAARGREDPEHELLDTGAFDEDRYWDLTVDYAKAAPDDHCIRLTVRNAGPERATLTVLPTLWCRNTWAWDETSDPRPEVARHPQGLRAWHPELGALLLAGAGAAEGPSAPEALVCDNDTNTRRLWGQPGPAFPKDGINDHVVHGAATVNPGGVGTKGALRYDLTVDPGAVAEVRLRLAPDPASAGSRDGPVSAGVAPDLAGTWEDAMAARAQEADAFYAALAPTASPEDAAIMRQAFAGMLWGKQLYHYDVARWLDGDPTQPAPPPERRQGRNSDWRHVHHRDIISMPDPWEYPWYAAWDLAFHCVPLAHLDPAFAKEQLLLLCREWSMHPNGQLPAYEWAFGDVNPPVHAWAALRVFEIDGSHDHAFLARVLHKLLLNFTWWVNRKDVAGDNVFEGGFLGLDNIGPIDRSATLPDEARLEQSDGTAWMAMYCLNLLEMTLHLAEHDPTYEDLAVKFATHFAAIATAMHEAGLWDEADGFYYDHLRCIDEARVPLRVRSMVGLIPLFAVTTLGRDTRERLPAFTAHFDGFLARSTRHADVIGHCHVRAEGEGQLLSVVSPQRLTRILATLFDEDEFLSLHGVRSLSRHHRSAPFTVELAGHEATVGYEPGESATGLFGGNSNWRGPVWFPVNYLLIESLRRFHRLFGDDLAVEVPSGSGHALDLGGAADELSHRLIGLFRSDADGRRPAAAAQDLQHDPRWRDRLLFFEYFHGDTGAGLGAAHQTGWTGLVADLIVQAANGAPSATERNAASQPPDAAAQVRR